MIVNNINIEVVSEQVKNHIVELIMTHFDIPWIPNHIEEDFYKGILDVMTKCILESLSSDDIFRRRLQAEHREGKS